MEILSVEICLRWLIDYGSIYQNDINSHPAGAPADHRCRSGDGKEAFQLK